MTTWKSSYSPNFLGFIDAYWVVFKCFLFMCIVHCISRGYTRSGLFYLTVNSHFLWFSILTIMFQPKTGVISLVLVKTVCKGLYT